MRDYAFKAAAPRFFPTFAAHVGFAGVCHRLCPVAVGGRRGGQGEKGVFHIGKYVGKPVQLGGSDGARLFGYAFAQIQVFVGAQTVAHVVGAPFGQQEKRRYGTHRGRKHQGGKLPVQPHKIGHKHVGNDHGQPCNVFVEAKEGYCRQRGEQTEHAAVVRPRRQQVAQSQQGGAHQRALCGKGGSKQQHKGEKKKADVKFPQRKARRGIGYHHGENSYAYHLFGGGTVPYPP